MPRTPGIEVRHARSCRTGGGGRCNCSPTYRASVWSERDGKLIRKSFPTSAAAKSWRVDASHALARGVLRPPTATTVEEAANAWLEEAEAGTARDRSGHTYKPSTVRGYERCLRLRVLPKLGKRRISDVRRTDVQALVDDLAATLSPSTVRNTLDPLRAIYRRAVNRELVGVNPTHGLELPASRGGRDRIATAEQAAKLIAAAPVEYRALWATAFYAGLRRGELRALRVCDLDLGKSEIRVERSWDDKAGPIAPKSAKSLRVVPLLGLLRDHLDERVLQSGRSGPDLIFGRTASEPFIASTVRARCHESWEDAELEPIGLHECRHCFASLLIDAGANAKAIQEFLGHATIQMTFDRYGHLMPGRRDEIRQQMDSYLALPPTARDTSQSRRMTI